MSLHALARRMVPFSMRVEWTRLRRLPSWRKERDAMALEKARQEDLTSWSPIANYASPLRRPNSSVDSKLQAGKEHNVRIAARALDRIVVRPGQTFSYHHAVGRPSRWRGFRKGLELHDGTMGAGIGGGCCQVSNMLYWLALNAGLAIVERHRHALDLFPDHGRNVPFGCGATVFYNLSDLRFRNPHPFPVALSFDIDDRNLRGRILASEDPTWRVEVYETQHHFFRDGESWYRENRVHRRFLDGTGVVIRDEEIAHNQGRCLYDPESVAPC